LYAERKFQCDHGSLITEKRGNIHWRDHLLQIVYQV